MDILFDEEQLLQLVTNLYVLTGLTANILDPQGRDIHLFKDHPPFCRAVNDLPEGHQRCVDCDMWKVRNYTAEKGFQLYRCHAGICEAVMPLYDKKNPLAYLIFGCYLDDSPIEAQWERTRPLMAWWPQGPDALKDAFFQFRQYSSQEIQAYAETLEALSAYIRLKGMILTTEQTDAQRLELFLDQHYMDKPPSPSSCISAAPSCAPWPRSCPAGRRCPTLSPTGASTPPSACSSRATCPSPP